MNNGFVKVAAATPDIRVADVEFNKENICRGIEEAEKANAKILVFPELCVTGYTCSDLFDHAVLLKAAKKALLEIAEFTRDRDLLVFVGVPLEVDGKTYLNYISNTIRFKCDWKKKLFSTSYTVASEMVVTDKREGMLETIPNKEAFSLNQIFYDKVDEYWSPDFWGNYNIIEPTESLEHAVDKLKKQSN